MDMPVAASGGGGGLAVDLQSACDALCHGVTTATPDDAIGLSRVVPAPPGLGRAKHRPCDCVLRVIGSSQRRRMRRVAPV